MNEDVLNLSIRKFLKQFGVTAQREIEHAVERGLAEGKLTGQERVSVRATLQVERLVDSYQVDGEIVLG